MPRPAPFKLRRERLNRGLSQKALADAAGVHRRVIEEIEANGSIPRPRSRKALADYFGLEVSDIWPD